MYLTLKIEDFRLKYSNSRNTICACLIIGIVLVFLNFPNKILSGVFELKTTNKTSVSIIKNICFETKYDDELILFFTKVN